MRTKNSWLDTAVSGIRFGADRAEVRQELQDHIEDKASDLMRIFPDMTEEEALERALAGMGDPEELKVSLAKIHRPWLGYLWVLSRLMLAPVILFWLGFLFLVLISLPDWEARQVIFGIRETAWSRETANRSVPMERDPELVRIDDCVLSMGRVWLVDDPEEGQVLQVELRLFSPLIWVEEHQFFRKVSAVDSNGTVYAANDTWWEDWSSRPEHWVDGRQSPWYESMLPRLFQERYILSINGVDPGTEWVRLEYDWLGRSFSMTVDLKEAGM